MYHHLPHRHYYFLHKKTTSKHLLPPFSPLLYSITTHQGSSSMALDQDPDQNPVQFPLDPKSYKILDEIGVGVSAIVYKAACVPLNSTVVAIKSIDLDQSRADFDNIRREIKTMTLLSHPNILKAHCSFTVDRRLWVVMPFMSAGSLQSIIASNFPDGLPETCIAAVLKETLAALAYLHQQGHLHRDIKAGNILMDSAGRVKLADFGVSASIYEPSGGSAAGSTLSACSSRLMLTDVAGTPYWMAPEVIHSHTGYSFKADIWSFGITALELAHGCPPLSHLPLSKSLIMKITTRFRFSDYQKQKNDRKFSKSFKDMVASCLDQDPSKRPSAEKLLKHPFFKNSKNADFLVKNVLIGLPSVELRFKEGKSVNIEEDEENPEGDELVKSKIRRISGWNFNQEGFELNPVFPADDSSRSSSSEGNHSDNALTCIDKESMVGGLMVLKRSLDEQRQKVVNLIGMFGMEVPTTPVTGKVDVEVVEKLKMEVEEEKRKNCELEMELESLKMQISGAYGSGR